jgi:hypothetical protein
MDSQTNSDSELDSLRPNLRPIQHPATGEYRRIDITPDHETPAYSTSPQVTATDPPNSNTVQSRFESELGHASSRLFRRSATVQRWTHSPDAGPGGRPNPSTQPSTQPFTSCPKRPGIRSDRFRQLDE